MIEKFLIWFLGRNYEEIIFGLIIFILTSSFAILVLSIAHEIIK